MFGIGTTEVIVILVVALLVIGPSKLPDAARALGKGLAEFRRMSSDVKKTLDMESKLSEQEESKPRPQEAATGNDLPGTDKPSGLEADRSTPDQGSEEGAFQSPTGSEEAELRSRLEPDPGERSGERS